MSRTFSRRSAAVALAVMTFASLALRLVGIGFQLPQFVPVDALVLASEVEVLRHHQDPRFRLHPNLYPQLLPALALFTPPPRNDGNPPRSLKEHLSRARAPYLRICFVIALLSVLAIPATYLLARHFLDRGASLMASFLVATSVLHLWFSQQARPHSGAVTFTLLAVLAALRLARKPSLSTFLIAGLAVAGAFAALQSGVAAFLPFVAAFLLRERSGTAGRARWAFLLSATLAVALGLKFYPSMAGTHQTRSATSAEFLALHGSTLNLMGHGVDLTGFNGGGVPILCGALGVYDPILSLLACLGIVLGIHGRARRGASRERRRSLLVVLAYVVPYALVVGLYRVSGQRFVIPLIPFLAVCGAKGVQEIWAFASEHRPRARVCVGAAIGALLLVQGAAAASLAWIRSRPDTSTEVAEWLQAHTDRNEPILLSPGVELPLLRTEEAIKWSRTMLPNPNERWLAYQQEGSAVADTSTPRFDLRTLPVATPEDRARLLGDPTGYLHELGARWIVLEVHRTWDWKGIARLRESLARTGTLAARLSPDRHGTWGEVPIAHQGFDPRPFPVFWFLRILQARCTGMVLEIWRLPS